MNTSVDPSPGKSNRVTGPVTDLSPDPTFIEYISANEDNPSDDLFAKDTISSDNLPAIQSLINHSPANDKSSSARKEIRNECNKSMPASRN